MTIGHATVLATVTFFGHSEIYGHRAVTTAKGDAGDKADATALALVAAAGDKGSKAGDKGKGVKESSKEAVASLASGAGDLPTDELTFEWQNDYLWQDEMRRGRGGGLGQRRQASDQADDGSGVTDSEACSSSESAPAKASRPTAATADAAGAEGSGGGGGLSVGPSLPGLQWAMLEFDTAVYAPLSGGLLVASRLDADVNTANCRIAFFGRMVARVQVK